MEDPSDMYLLDANLIRVHVLDYHASSTTLRVQPDTTAAEICKQIAGKLAIQDTDSTFYTLVCVYIEVKEDKYDHVLKTLQPVDRVLAVQEALHKRHHGPGDHSYSFRWYYKDIRSPPLEFDGDVSGDESSDDENELPLSDLLYIGTGDRRGFLLKRSTRDMNLWRRRLCILNDKLWCINVRKDVPTASQIKLDGRILLQDEVPELQYPYGFVVHSRAKTHFFRASSASEQYRWRDELVDRAAFTAENDVLVMAEMITCDEEDARASRRHAALASIARLPRVVSALHTNYISTLTPPIKLSRALRRRAETVSCLHALHVSHCDIAAAMALLSACNDYKDCLRLDMGLSHTEQWLMAVRVYRDHLLPHLTGAGCLRSSSSDNNLNVNKPKIIANSNTSLHAKFTDRQSSNSSLNGRGDSKRQARYLPISSDIITRAHREIFSNVRKISRIAQLKEKRSNSLSPAKSSRNYWLWPGSPGVEDANIGSAQTHAIAPSPVLPLIADVMREYEVIDVMRKPPLNIFDDAALEIFRLLSDAEPPTGSSQSDPDLKRLNSSISLAASDEERNLYEGVVDASLINEV